jgi:hypothetical protein
MRAAMILRTLRFFSSCMKPLVLSAGSGLMSK